MLIFAQIQEKLAQTGVLKMGIVWQECATVCLVTMEWIVQKLCVLLANTTTQPHLPVCLYVLAATIKIFILIHARLVPVHASSAMVNRLSAQGVFQLLKILNTSIIALAIAHVLAVHLQMALTVQYVIQSQHFV